MQIVDVRFLKTILITLGRLVKEVVDLAGAQQLNQLRQRTVVDIVVTLNFQRRGFTLTRVARHRFILGPAFFRFSQRFRGNLHQLGDGGAATDVVLIHHVTDPGAVKRVAGLQQGNPAAVQPGLLLTHGL